MVAAVVVAQNASASLSIMSVEAAVTGLETVICCLAALAVGLVAAGLLLLIRSLTVQGDIRRLLAERTFRPGNDAAAEANPPMFDRPSATDPLTTGSSPASPCEAITPKGGATSSDIRPDHTKRRRRFKVVLADSLLPVVHEYVTNFLKQNGAEQEAGGMLVGDYVLDAVAEEATFQIRGFIEAGPKAEFSSGCILFDGDYQAQALRALQLEHPTAANLGCVHRHPGSLDVCSGGDAVTDRRAVQDSDTKALVFAIITLNNSRRGPSSLFFKNLKIDFYCMADETDLQYVPIIPTIADLPLLEVSPVLSSFLELRGASAAYDLAVLQQLPGLSRATLHPVASNAGAGVVLGASLTESLETLHIWLRPDGSLCVAIRPGTGRTRVLAGPWEQAAVGQHVWLSHVLLKAQEAMRKSTSFPAYGPHAVGLLHDKHRLVAEVRAMQERYGNLARLKQRGDTLYWEYVVQESGRAFPIEVHYPETYPAEPPLIRSVKPLPSSPHQLPNNILCWIDVYSAHSDWNPSRDTAVICLNAAHRWFACLLVYLTKGHWPEGAGH